MRALRQQAHELLLSRVPDAGQHSAAHIPRQLPHLRFRPISQYQEQSVDMALHQPAKRQVRAADRGEHPQQRGLRPGIES
jgi:hypothetical protein